METETITLANLLARPQSVLVPGAGEVLFGVVGSADAEVEVTKDVADYVEQVLGPTVKRIDLASKVESHAHEVTKVIPLTMFLANMTGDPDAAEVMITGEMFTNRQSGERTSEKAPNRNKNAQALNYQLFGGDELIRNKWGLAFTITHPPRSYTIPEYGQIEVPVEVGNDILRQDQNRATYMQGAVIKSRNLEGAFVPNARWGYDELRMYLRLIDPTCPHFGLTSEALKAKLAAEGEESGAIQLEINRVKKLHWKRCILRAMNPKYRLPSQEEFELAMAKGAEKPVKAVPQQQHQKK